MIFCLYRIGRCAVDSFNPRFISDRIPTMLSLRTAPRSIVLRCTAVGFLARSTLRKARSASPPNQCESQVREGVRTCALISGLSSPN